MKTFLIPYFYNGIGSTLEFDISIIDEVTEFIFDKSIEIIQQTNCDNDDIIVCMPKWLITFLSHNHHWIIHRVKIQEINGELYFGNLKVQFYFANEVTVFFNNINPDNIIKYTKEL